MADGGDGGRFLSYLFATRLHDLAIPVTREFLDADPGLIQKGQGGAEFPLRHCPRLLPRPPGTTGVDS